jgi:hypothetical protein
MERPAIVGNKWVLIGAVLYLLEWVAIIPADPSGPADAGASRATVLGLYHHHPKAVLFLTTWISVVLLGRILIVTGLRAALRSVGVDSPLMDLAAFAMVASVAIELGSQVFIGAAQVLAQQGGHDDAVLTLDTLGGVAWRCIFGPLGLSVALAAWSMLQSRAFAAWICWVGLVGGFVLMVGGAFSGPGYLESGFSRGLGNAAMGAIPLFWIWMLATGVFLWRRVPSKTEDFLANA